MGDSISPMRTMSECALVCPGILINKEGLSGFLLVSLLVFGGFSNGSIAQLAKFLIGVK